MTSADFTRFEAKFSVCHAGACWPWLAAKDGKGYGLFSLRGRTRRAHRVAYEYFVGPIQSGLQLDHLCRNRSCVNPAHLEPVTPGENTRRGHTGMHNASKTHCPHGHEYSAANTYQHPRGQRCCRACHTARQARRRESLFVGGARYTP